MLPASTIRIAALLLLTSVVLGALFNQYFVGPVIFNKDFLTTAAAHESKVITGVLLSIVDVLIGFCIVILLWPAFSSIDRNLTMLYAGIAIMAAIPVILDDVNALAIVNLSKSYVSEPDPGLIPLSKVLFKARWWTHYFTLLMAGPMFGVFNLLLFQSKLAPRLLSVWGIVGALLLMIEIILSMYGKPTNMMMLMPFGLQQMVLIVWWLIRPVKASA